MENKILDLVKLPRPLLLLEIFTCVHGPNQKFRKKGEEVFKVQNIVDTICIVQCTLLQRCLGLI